MEKLNKKAIFVNTATQIIVRILGLVLALISVKLLTNYLGKTGFGNYNSISTYLNFFIVIADLGLFSVAVREISKNPDQEKKIISNVFIIRVATALFASIVAVIIVFFTKYSADIKLGTLVASGFIFFNLLASVYDVVLQYRLKMQYSALAELLSKIVALAALYFIIIAHGNFLSVIFTITLSGFLMFVFKWLFSLKFIKFGLKFDNNISKWIFNLAWPLGLVFIVNNLFFKIDTIMLFVIKGPDAVGVYGVAYKVLEVTIFIGGYFASSLKPTISKNIHSSKSYVGDLIQKSFIIMLFFSLPITVICIAFSKDIIIFLSNAEFIAGAKALIILALTLPLIYLDVLLGEILIANDERKLMIRISIFALLFNFIANLIFIPLYSLYGAAFTTLLSELVLLLINYHYTKKILGYHLNYKKIFRIIMISIICLLLGYVIRETKINFLILSAFILIVYAFLSQIFDIVTLKTVRQLINR